MNSRDIVSIKKDILINLSKRQLKDAFRSLKKLTKNTQDWKITETLSELETNYKFMLHYLFEGVEDTQRENVYRNLLRSLYELTDDSTDELMKVESSGIYYEKSRISALKNNSVVNYQNLIKEITDSFSLVDLLEEGEEKINRKKDLAIRRERIGSEMFNSVYVSSRADEEEMNNYLALINNPELPVREKCLFLSALTLGLFHRFDGRKTQILMYAAASEDMQLRARAIVGLVIVMQMYDVRWNLYPELQNQLAILSENPNFKKNSTTCHYTIDTGQRNRRDHQEDQRRDTSRNDEI